MIPLEPVAWTEPIPANSSEHGRMSEFVCAQLGTAAIELANSQDIAIRDVAFDDICARAGVPRSSSYRHVRGTIRLVEDFVEPSTERLLVASVHSSVGLVTHAKRTPWTSRSMLTAGAHGLMTGLCLAPYTSRYLMHRPDLAAEYLTRSGESSPSSRLATRLGECALRSGVELHHQELVALIEALLAAATANAMEFGVWPSGTPTWPRWIDTQLRERGPRVGVDDMNHEPISMPSPIEDRRREIALGLLAGR
jgi:AcrR family transcriptional regulator